MLLWVSGHKRMLVKVDSYFLMIYKHIRNHVAVYVLALFLSLYGGFALAETVVVEADDTLEGISERTGVSVETLIELNNLGADANLYVGDTLLLDEESQLDIETITIFIETGDNLSDLARKYGTNVNTLVELNDIEDPNIIRVGSPLIVPDIQGLELDEDTNLSAREAGGFQVLFAEANGSNSIVVQPGDTLTAIALENDVPVTDIMIWNNLQSDFIVVGDILFISPPSGSTDEITGEEANENAASTDEASTPEEAPAVDEASSEEASPETAPQEETNSVAAAPSASDNTNEETPPSVETPSVETPSNEATSDNNSEASEETTALDTEASEEAPSNEAVVEAEEVNANVETSEEAPNNETIPNASAEPLNRPIVVGSKSSKDQLLYAELIAQMMEASGLEVERKLALGNSLKTRQALLDEDIDIYVEETGTALSNYFHSYGVGDLPMEILANQEASRSLTVSLDSYHGGVIWMCPAPVNNAFVLVGRSNWTDENNIGSVQDLADYLNNGGEATFLVDRELIRLGNALPIYEESYGFVASDSIFAEELSGEEFQDFGQSIDYLLSEREGIDIVMVSSTEPRLKTSKVSILADINSVQPVLNPSPVIRSEVLKATPELQEQLCQVFNDLDNFGMSQLKEQFLPPADAAESFLLEFGFIED